MSAIDTFKTAEEFVTRLRTLRQGRRCQRMELRDRLSRKPLSRSDRDEIFKKTDGRCHICGGLIEGTWDADHVFSHSLGGQHDANNYLPAHEICDNYRWFYGAEEFQWILKLGVWIRTQIEKETVLGRLAAKAFCTYDRNRAGRRVSSKRTPKVTISQR